jgi:hypothetical protein
MMLRIYQQSWVPMGCADDVRRYGSEVVDSSRTSINVLKYVMMNNAG